MAREEGGAKGSVGTVKVSETKSVHRHHDHDVGHDDHTVCGGECGNLKSVSDKIWSLAHVPSCKLD